ncbi:hypothetical protein [Magnetospirillum sp. 64-120]|uniref:hypothetical protein n=1 Tax=Magnetospirillum sp. 64-120 TaxID=1895778 RepID=UPI0025B7F07F|nr:hypothetical protein [Magnetospirillum sp. 64-120]
MADNPALLPQRIALALPASVRTAANYATAWHSQPLFTMSDDQAAKIKASIAIAQQDLVELFRPTDPKEVVEFMARLATRRNIDLPPAPDLAADALAISSKLPADLFNLACQRLWTDFAYRRLPEPSDFTNSVADLLEIRTTAQAKIHNMEMRLASRQILKEKSSSRRSAQRG